MTCLIIDRQLILQYHVPMLVDLIRRVSFVLLACVYRAPFTIPDTQTPLVHPFPLPSVAACHPSDLLLRSNIGFWRSRETVSCIIVDSVRRVSPSLVRITELTKVRRKGVSVPENDMLIVYGANGVVNSIVEADEPRMLGVCRLIERIVASDPRIVLVVFRQFTPKPHETVLEVFVSPESSDVDTSIGMPVGILPAGSGVHIKDCVDPMLCTDVYYAIEVLEPLGLQDAWVHIILEVLVINGDPNAIQSEGLEEHSIILLEEVF